MTTFAIRLSHPYQEEVHDVGLLTVTVFSAQQTILDSVKKEDHTFKGDGFTSLAIVYAVFSLANWISPSVVAVLGPVYSMGFSALLYT